MSRCSAVSTGGSGLIATFLVRFQDGLVKRVGQGRYVVA